MESPKPLLFPAGRRAGTHHLEAPSQTSGLAYQARVLRAVAGTQFKLRYADSVLGYAWSLMKPLAIFAVLYLVFGRFLDLELGFAHFPLYLLVGIVLWTFFADATATTMPSIVTHGQLLRKLAFPHLIVPLSTTVTAGITLCVNLLAVAAFVASSRITPRLEWLVILPLLAELYVFTLGLALVLTTLFVRLRDTDQLWELATQLLFWLSAIVYPVGLLPSWGQGLVFLNPFVQVVQDVRHVLLAASERAEITVASDAFGHPAGHLIPIAVAVATLAFGIALFRRHSPMFAERV